MLQRFEPDALFHALGDPTRRALLDRLSGGPTSVSRLASPFAMSLSAVAQHLKVLEASGLIVTRKSGRVREVALVPEALGAAERWLSDHRARWEQRFDRLGQLLDEETDEDEGETR